jgi:hypothetical protein
MIPDFDNTQKWLKWIKTKRFFKVWMISPILLSIIIIFLWKQNANLKVDLEKTRNEIAPIKQLYPKLELSAAVAQLIEKHNQLSAEVDLAKQKEEQKRFVPLSQNRVAEFRKKVRSFVNNHSDLNFNVQVLSVNPSNDLYQKAIELVNLFKSANVTARYANTMFSSKHNVVIKCSEALPKDVINELNQFLKVVFKNELNYELLKSGGKDSDGDILIYFLGIPSFDSEGCVFYETPIF